MKKRYLYIFWVFFIACNTTEKEKLTITANEVVGLNQLIYKDSSEKVFAQYAKNYELVFHPHSIDGNYAVIAKHKSANKYNLLIRGSVIEFSNEGFQNFIIQDFNIFTMQKWIYTDTVQDAYVANGAYIGFQNLLKLKDRTTQLSIKEYIEKNIPKNSLLTITGHSLGGNLANLMASYLKKELKNTGKINMQLITFGAPASGNQAFVQNLENQFPQGERYAIELDIACSFPDLGKIGSVASKIGLDSSLHLGTISIDNTTQSLKVGTVLKIAEDILNKTNIIDEKRKYVQSEKHLKALPFSPPPKNAKQTIDQLFGTAFKYHSVDQYATLLNGDIIKE